MKTLKNLPLSDIQRDCIKSILKEFETNNRQILAWYTGSGKTNVFLGLASEITARDPKAIVGISCYLHTTIKLQTSERADSFNLLHQVISAHEKEYGSERVVIFNPQTVLRRELPFKFTHLIIDEAHIATHNTATYFKTLIENNCVEKVKVLGCSATPWGIINTDLFKRAKLHIRGMDKGLHEDGRLQDFVIHAEKSEFKSVKTVFSRDGDLSQKFISENFEALKLSTIAKLKSVIEKNAEHIGKKCLVIVPPGHGCAIAEAAVKELGKSASHLIGTSTQGGDFYRAREKKTIEEFRTNPKKRFLIVVHKCQIGFDMPELESTIDLTMTRNISLLIQRWGRLARVSPENKNKKHYFYCFDDSLTPDLVEWLLATSIDFAMCKWNGEEPKKSISAHRTRVFGSVSGGKADFEVDFSYLMALQNGLVTSTSHVMTFSKETRPSGAWTIEAMKAECRKFDSRSALSEGNRYVYQQLLNYYPEILNEIFPPKYKRHSMESVVELLERLRAEGKSRNWFRNRHSGVLYWLQANNKMNLLETYFPSSRTEKWNKKTVLGRVARYPSMKSFKSELPGAYRLAEQWGFLEECRELVGTGPLDSKGRPRKRLKVRI